MELSQVPTKLRQALENIKTKRELEALKAEFIGKKSVLQQHLSEIKNLSGEDRIIKAKTVNQVKQEIEALIFSHKTIDDFVASTNEVEDIFLNTRIPFCGSIHPVMKIADMVKTFFRVHGFIEVEANDVDNDWNNFGSLNMNEGHPARQMHDTFYMKTNNTDYYSNSESKTSSEPVSQLKSGSKSNADLNFDPSLEVQVKNNTELNAPPTQAIQHDEEERKDKLLEERRGKSLLLRTHTSNTQVKYMKRYECPMRFFSCGRVYRKDSDKTHTPMFHQIEGVLVDKNVSIAQLKWTLIKLIEYIFGENLETRFRPSFFPFTQPSLEVDIMLNGKWLEVLGSGMLHNNVLTNADIDPEKYSGFALGIGLDRLAMIKYNIPDLRSMFEGNVDFMQNFNLKS